MLFLSEIFPGRIAVSPAEAGMAVFGWSPQTCRNRLAKNIFPFSVTKVGGKRVVLLAEIEAKLGLSVGQHGATENPAPLARRRPGRPRKEEGRP